jgi:diguanylate cyclase (GGDEF)-like protein
MADVASWESLLADPDSVRSMSVLIIDQDSDHADTVGQLIDRVGANWIHASSLDEVTAHRYHVDHAVVMINGSIIQKQLSDGGTEIRGHFEHGTVLVGLVDSSVMDSPTLLGAGLDLIIHDPLGVADIQRVLMFAGSIRSETAQQSRERLRKMNALHQLAISSGRQTSVPGWLDRLVEAGQRIIGCDALAMWSLDATRQQLRCSGSVGLPRDYVIRTEMESAAVIDRYPSLLIENASSWLSPDGHQGESDPVVPDAAREVGIQRIAWLPVRDSHRAYGHLSFYFTSMERFERYDLILADAFASIVGASLGSYALQAEIHRSNRLYREHVEMSPHGVIICRMDGAVERTNSAMSTIAGRDRYDILGNPVSALFASPGLLPWQRWMTLDYDDRDDAVMLWVVRPDGMRRRVSCHARRLELPHGVAVDDTEDRIELVLEDVTVQARRLVELELLHELTRLFSEHGSIDQAFNLVVDRLYAYFGYYFVNIGVVEDKGRRLVPRAFRTRGGVEHIPSLDATTGICGRATRENRSILVTDVTTHPDYFSIDPTVHSELVSVIRAGGRPVALLDIQTDSAHPIDENDLHLADSISAHLGLLIEQTSVNERLERQAMTDPLIRIANRRALMEALDKLVANRDAEPAGLYLVELDNFKAINDQYGHLFGDEMLVQVGQRLQTVLRGGDLLARYGGDELAVIVKGLTADRAMIVGERLREVISSEPFEHNGQTVSITVSIGVALFPTHGRTIDALVGEADRAMYSAKISGRNRVHAELTPSGGDEVIPEP